MMIPVRAVNHERRVGAQQALGRVGHRERLRGILSRRWVRYAIVYVIAFNAITLGMQATSLAKSPIGPVLDGIDRVVLAIFVVELALKLWAHGRSFFRDPWNVFDLAIVSVGFVPAIQSFTALRALRAIRLLRLLSSHSQIRAVLNSLAQALPGMSAIIVMLAIVYYLFAVIATMMWGRDVEQYFGSLGTSLISLFQVSALEGWPQIAESVVEGGHPWAWAFFVVFIVCTTFTILNLFIGLIVSTMQSVVEQRTEKEIELLSSLVAKEAAELDARIAALQAEFRDLRQSLVAAGERPAG